uniref:Tail protein n=1 Tax=viral metagenome TaxID=1070528 RepID=A0A6M3IPI3_9ZZZZ
MPPIASDIEIMVMGWLDRKGIQYSFQSSLAGGLFELGEAAINFIIPDFGIALRVRGEYYSRESTPTGIDLVQEEVMKSQIGLIAVDVWESDIKRDLNGTMESVLRGD